MFNMSGLGQVGLTQSVNFIDRITPLVGGSSSGDPAVLTSQLTKEQELNAELKKQMRFEKAQSAKSMALLEQ